MTKATLTDQLAEREVKLSKLETRVDALTVELDDAQKENERLRSLLREEEKAWLDVQGELDRQGAPAGSSISQRIREWGRANVKKSEEVEASITEMRRVSEQAVQEASKLHRQRMSVERKGSTHHFVIHTEGGDVDGYITANVQDDGSGNAVMREILIRMGKADPAVAGLFDNLATIMSIALQYGVPLDVLCEKLIGHRYEPAGMTDNPNIRIATSVVDYLGRWLRMKYLSAAE